MTATAAHKRAVVKYRLKQRRVELLMDPASDEAKALDELTDLCGSQAAAIRHALLTATLPKG